MCKQRLTTVKQTAFRQISSAKGSCVNVVVKFYPWLDVFLFFSNSLCSLLTIRVPKSRGNKINYLKLEQIQATTFISWYQLFVWCVLLGVVRVYKNICACPNVNKASKYFMFCLTLFYLRVSLSSLPDLQCNLVDY